jgi:hypothetical protein
MCRTSRSAEAARLLLAGLAALGACSANEQNRSCPPLDSLAPWAVVSRTWSIETGLRWSNDSLRQVLLGLAEQDQAARKDFGARVMDSSYARELGDLDRDLAARLSAILDRFGLPTRSMVGAAGSDAAFLVVQHNESLQKRVLALAHQAPAGEVSPQALAMLEDRVLVHEGRPQRFGTQFTIQADGRMRFAETEETAGLAARRTAAGLPPLSQYTCLMEESGMVIDRSSLPPRL